MPAFLNFIYEATISIAGVLNRISTLHK